MIGKRRALLVSILFCTLIVPCVLPAQPARASLNQYVKKYKELQVTAQQQRRIQHYDYLITYFCSFAFFKPRHKVNPDFIRALILAESDCQPKAKSRRNAKGLTQIIFTTGKQAAKELARKNIHFRYVSKEKLRNFKEKDLYDPAVNILLSCYLIAKYNIQHNGRLDLVVSAWNAGEYSIKDHKPAQYKETLNHIGKVNGYFIYFLRHKNRARRYALRR